MIKRIFESNLNQAYLFALASVLLWSTVATAFKVALGFMSPLMLLWIASFCSLIIYAIAITFKKKWSVYQSWTIKDWLFSLVLGAINPFIYYIVLFNAYDKLPAQEASTLNYSWPIVLVVLSSLINKTRLRLRSLIALFICFFGALLIACHGDIFALQFSNKFGVFLALFSTILWATFWLINNRDSQPATSRFFINFVFGFCLLSLYLLIFNQFEMISAKGLMAGIYVGFFEMGITFLCWQKALKLADKDTDKVSILIYIIPFISLWIIQAVLGEPILPSTVTGLIFIIGGIILQKTDKVK